jgi:membrane protease YdiL (CAAX protease family)
MDMSDQFPPVPPSAPQPQPPLPQQPQPQPYQQQPQPQPQPYQQQPQPQPYQQPYQPQPQPQPYQPQQPQPLQVNPAALYKRQLRTVITSVVLALFLFYAINLFASFVVGFIAILSSGAFGDILAQPLDSSNLEESLTQRSLMEAMPLGLMSIVGIVAGACALFIVRGKRLLTEDLTKVNERISLPDFIKLACLMLGINAIFTLLPMLMELLAPGIGKALEGPLDDMLTGYFDLSGILYIVLLGPIVEEIIFRGAILRALVPFGRNFAIIISSLAFGLYHLYLMQGMFAFLVGVLFAYCTLRFSIKWAMLLHILNNGLSVVFSFLGVSPLIITGCYALFLVLGIIVALISLPRFRQQLQEGKPPLLAPIILPTPPTPWQQPGAQTTFAQPAPALYGEPIAQPAPVTAPRARPFAIAFSSAWLLTGASIALILSTLTMVVF